MGAHKKYRDIMADLESAGISTAILKQGKKTWKVIAGGNHKTFRHRITCNKYLIRIHDRECKQPILVN